MLALGYCFWSEWELAEKVDFDGVNKLIIVYDHVTELDIREDVWSAWVRWDAMLDRNYNRFLPAMERTGLDSIPGGETGDFYFLTNGWRLVIKFANVKVLGVLYSRDFDTAYYTDELKAQYPAQVSSIVNTVSGAPAITGDIADVPDLVWNDVIERAENSKGGYIDHLRHLDYSIFVNSEYVPEVGDVPDGSQHFPFNEVNDAIDFGEAHKIKSIFLQSELEPALGKNVKNFILTGIGLQSLVLDGQDFNKTELRHIQLSGNYLGSIIAQDSMVSGTNTTINGQFGNCTFTSSFEVPDGGAALIQHSSSSVKGVIKPTFSVGGFSGTARLQFAGHFGGVTITNCNQPTDDVKFIGTGIVEIESSCTDGLIVIVGLIAPIDNSGAGCNVQWINVDPTKLSDIPDDVWSYIR